MLKKMLKWTAVFLTVSAAVFAALLFVPKDNGRAYRIKIAKNQGISSVGRKLAEDRIVFSRHVLTAAAYVLGVHNRLHTGTYRLPSEVSAWDILQKMRGGRPDSVTVQIIEGSRFSHMRKVIDATPDIGHDTKGWSNEKLMAEVAPDVFSGNPEGQFFPDSYEIDAGGSDLQIYQTAYKAMQRRLNEAWAGRQDGLPYKNPYEMLIMASLIEKETGHEADRDHVASVFVNRLKIGMRLQTDPSVIYGMGAAYKGKIRKADLRRDTPYNTYTRGGLPPTPIALPGKAALDAAAHPSGEKYLYFVSKMDGTGLSQFSHDLTEHNAAVRKYILKK
ncbi:TPA: endolytic transglycosylase MltG [Neisseria gonorrhoeae]